MQEMLKSHSQIMSKEEPKGNSNKLLKKHEQWIFPKPKNWNPQEKSHYFAQVLPKKPQIEIN